MLFLFYAFLVLSSLLISFQKFFPIFFFIKHSSELHDREKWTVPLIMNLFDSKPNYIIGAIDNVDIEINV